MDKYFVDLHSIVAYVFVISTIILVAMSIYRYSKNMHFVARQEKLMKVSFISAHIQLLLGIVIWVMRGHFNLLMTEASAVMKVDTMRLLCVEHPMTNIIGVTILTLGYLKIKRSKSEKNKNTMIYFGIALLLILSRIPWSQWLS